MNNPYEPPSAEGASQSGVRNTQRVSKPIIPAVIGIFTWGASSPYALVLCVEQYLKRGISPIHWSTHVAALLSILGTVAWTAVNVFATPEILNLVAGNGRTMYSELAIMLWISTLVFFIWLGWRVTLFRTKEQAGNAQPQNNAMNTESPSPE